MDISRRSLLAVGASLLIWPQYSAAQSGEGDLTASFRNPPNAARPRVWWHWMNGNISPDGIERDLDWMRRVGIGGVHNFDASLVTPIVVDHEIRYQTPQWRALFRQAVASAHRRGFEFTIAASPGWSESGGPWVRPEQAMKKLVWSETPVEGGSHFHAPLAPPPQTAGPFGNIPVNNALSGHAAPAPAFYRDVSVFAVRTPSIDGVLNAREPVVTTSSGATLSAAGLKSEGAVEAFQINYQPTDAEVWIQFAFLQPQTARALTIACAKGALDGITGAGFVGRLEISDDGATFRKVSDLHTKGAAQSTLAFPPARARYFRIVIPADHAPPIDLGSVVIPSPTSVTLYKLVLHGGARIDGFENKAGFGVSARSERAAVSVERGAMSRRRDIVDLTGLLSADGVLDWTPPPGPWTVVRMGCSLTGVVNHPASPAGTGLEVDKLNRVHVRAYIDAYLEGYKSALGGDLIGAHGLTHMLNDSYEAGAANWTDGLFEKFEAKRGYDMRSWLPVLTGRVVESSEASEAFLWDFRKTLGDLIAEEHYGELSRALHELGMKRYGESHESGRAFIGDGMQVKKSADIPMSATWAAPTLGSEETHNADIRESASVAHIYGKSFVAAESLTAMATPETVFGFTPETLKPVADRMMAHGLNRFVIHTSVHQPLNRIGPGLTLGPFGQWFTRNETWAEQAGGWMNYLARSSHMLQQGRFVADIAYLYGEDTNITELFAPAPPLIPAGYNFDYINADALINELSYGDGAYRTSGGMSYRVLALDPSTARVSLAVLQKLGELAGAGGVIVGAKPGASPSLGDDRAGFQRLANAIWNRRNCNVHTGSIAEALGALDVAPDVSSPAESALQFVHRATQTGEFYFLRSGRNQAQHVDVSFRTTGKAPAIWRADTGEVQPASYRTENGRTIVPISFEAYDAVFVVFETATIEPSRAIAAPTENVISTLDGVWDVAFPPRLGAPTHIRLPALASWTENSDPGVRYFSGVGRYTHAFQASAPAPGERIFIDLGAVKNVADVIVNGRNLGTAWKPPFRIDITAALRDGRNRLEVRVANTWRNRLIGDQQPGATPIAFTTLNPLRAETPLPPSGLLGPVRILSQT